MAAHVHDMHLADGQGEGEDASADAAGSPAADAGAAAGGAAAPPGQTYAQATGLRQQSQAGGAAGSGGRGGSGSGTADQRQQQQHGAAGRGAPQPQPHLAFYMGGRLLAPGTTIFQAVQQQLAAAAAGGSGASGSGPGSSGGDLSTRLWGEVHTITYRSWGAAMQLQENEAATSVVSPRALAAGAAGRGAFGSDRMDVDGVESGPHDHDDACASPLAELLDAALPADVVASQVGAGGTGSGGWKARRREQAVGAQPLHGTAGLLLIFTMQAPPPPEKNQKIQ